MFEQKPVLVYCKYCRWNCNFTQCKKQLMIQQTPLESKVHYVNCFEKNEHNDCVDFEAKPYFQRALDYLF